MEEKQEFQLGDTFYHIRKVGTKYICQTGIVKQLSIFNNEILIKDSVGREKPQRDCGHTFEEAKQKLITKYENRLEDIKQSLKGLKEV